MLTAEQKAHLEKLSPGLAKRWASRDSRGLPPKKRSDATDFKGLFPGPKARHGISKPANEQQAMSNGHGINFQPESRPGPLKKG
jgi:hypothetical protein